MTNEESTGSDVPHVALSLPDPLACNDESCFMCCLLQELFQQRESWRKLDMQQSKGLYIKCDKRAVPVFTHFDEFVVVFLSQQGEGEERNIIFSPIHNQRKNLQLRRVFSVSYQE